MYIFSCSQTTYVYWSLLRRNLIDGDLKQHVKLHKIILNQIAFYKHLVEGRNNLASPFYKDPL